MALYLHIETDDPCGPGLSRRAADPRTAGQPQRRVDPRLPDFAALLHRARLIPTGRGRELGAEHCGVFHLVSRAGRHAASILHRSEFVGISGHILRRDDR